eukprot:8672197-Ditylum_brightwellii.AAC.1
MGNSNGGLADYWKLIRSNKGFQGGFIWDWIDQGILQIDKDGRSYWAYGGDFGDEPNDKNFNINGLVGPDRVPHPVMNECKYLFQPVTVTPLKMRQSLVRIENRRYFSSLDDLKCFWQVRENGKILLEGGLKIKGIGPGETTDISVPFKYPSEMSPGASYHLDLVFRTAEKTSWCPAGYEVAREQLELPLVCPITFDTVATEIEGSVDTS